MNRGFYVIGTAPEVGKTLFCAAFARHLANHDQRPGVFKPIDTGCPVSRLPDAVSEVGGIPGEVDAEAAQALLNLQQIAGPTPSYIIGQTPPSSLEPRDAPLLREAARRDDLELADISPYRYAPTLEPAICARYADAPIDFDELLGAYHVIENESDMVLVEGSWSLMSPIDQHRTQLDLVEALELPVILLAPSSPGVVGPCLTAASLLASRGVELSGVVLNRISSDLAFDEAANPFQIETHIGDVVRGVISHFESDKLHDLDHLAERLRVHVDLQGFRLETDS